MLKRFILTTVVVVVIIGALAGTKMLQFQAMGAAAANMQMPPETVTAATVEEGTWPNLITATGSIAAVQGVTVTTEVPGKVVEIAFESGAVVEAGDLLVKLDTSIEEAQLRAAEASADLANANLVRARSLREKQTNAQVDLDTAEAQAREAAAQLENIRAVIEKKTIRAPFAGRLGIRIVNLGQFLGTEDPIATLQTLDPVYVNFSVPQQNLSALQPGAAIRVTTDAAPDETFEGKINAISPEVDSVTRSLRVQATIHNVGEKLRTGMFANVEVVLPTAEKVLSIPATSVLYAPYGDSVFVIEEKKNEQSGEMEKVLRQQFVRLSGTRGDFVSISSGLEAGQTVVTSAPFKLRPGMAVVINNDLALEAKLEPKPENS
ncbi:MAG: efflux RND transporter periplasmic adaptor subunit [Opitutaceae bacterium]